MDSTLLLRCLAILLIINSHSEAFYPIAKLATGGAIGNSIFFVLSSYGLYLSEQKRSRPFFSWYGRRLARIYPTLWVVLLLLYFPLRLASQQLAFDDLLLYTSEFFYPKWWFLQALLVYYLALFAVVRNYKPIKLAIGMLGGLALYGYAYVNYLDITQWSIETLPFKVIFYLPMFLFGIYLASKQRTMRFAFMQDFAGFIVFTTLLYGQKFLTPHIIPWSLQFMQQLMLFPIAYFGFKVAHGAWVTSTLMQLPVVGATVRYIGKITLELYLVHIILLEWFIPLELAFPFNSILFLAATFGLASLFHSIANSVSAQFVKEAPKPASSPLQPLLERAYHGAD